MMDIKLPDEFGITVESTLDTSLAQIQKLLTANSEDEISLDFSDTQLLYPSSLVILTTIGNYLRDIKKCKIEQNMPKNPKTSNYLTESGFCQTVGIPPIVDKSVRPHNGSRIYRLKQFEYADDFEIEKLIDVINKELGLSNHTRIKVHETLAELIMNVYQHSNSSAGCYVMCQGYADTHEIRFCIGDAGIGIKNHLGKKYKELLSKNSAFAIELALIEGITGTMYNENSGMGLAYLKGFVNLVGGSFAILSGDGLYIEKTDSRGSKSNKKELEFEIPGTFVDVTIKSEQGLKVFSKSEPIPPEYRLIK